MKTGMPRKAAVVGFVLALVTSASAQDAADVSAASDRQAGGFHSDTLDDAWSALEPQLDAQPSRTLQRRDSPKPSPVLAKKGETGGYSWARTLGALAAVAGLIVLLAWGYRALTVGNLSLLGKARRPGLIEIISKTPLSARQSLCLVKIGPRLVLIGQSHDSLCALDVVEDADLAARIAGEAVRGRAGSSAAEFDDCLQRESKAYARAGDGIDETVVPDGRRIDSVREGVATTIQRIQHALSQH